MTPWPLIRDIFLLAIIMLLSGCATSDKVQDKSQKTPTPSTKNYTNTQYNIALEVPKSWVLLEESNLKIGDFAINIFSKNTEKEEGNLLNVHAPPQSSYITIWPKGIGTELPYSQYSPFNNEKSILTLPFEVDTSKSKILQLSDGSAWAYFIVPQNPPANWSEDGFIFAQIRRTNAKMICYDGQTEKQKTMEQCDFLEGDRVVRKGTLNKEDANIIHSILGSLSLEEIKDEETANDMIEVEKPLPNMDINSPLTVTGKAKGYWYFEGSFTIKLYDAYDNLLAKTNAEAKGDWMTEQFVPFEASISFEAPDDQRGHLVFERANPSGKPANEQSYTRSVIFPPK